VLRVDADSNRLTVERKDGTEQSYDPRRQQGVSVYREQERAFSVGDRVQLTAPSRDLKLANREQATVEGIGQDGRMSLKMDGGREFEIDSLKYPHLDHGYAVTSHSSQGQTADRVLIHVDTELGAKDLLNNRMAYVAVSLGKQRSLLFYISTEDILKSSFSLQGAALKSYRDFAGDGIFRVSIGLEAHEDLCADLDQALRKE
jgi:ATP-dependent exoDNAse (exonuclease V) alpha subunit